MRMAWLVECKRMDFDTIEESKELIEKPHIVSLLGVARDYHQPYIALNLTIRGIANKRSKTYRTAKDTQKYYESIGWLEVKRDKKPNIWLCPNCANLYKEVFSHNEQLANKAIYPY